MKKYRIFCGLALTVIMGLGSSAYAGFVVDTDLTEVNLAQATLVDDDAVIFGTGNDNGNFAVGRDNSGNFEVGLRAKIPYGSTLINAGTNTYSVATGVNWNFDWAVNTNIDGVGNEHLGDYTYKLLVDKYTINSGVQSLSSISWDPITLSSIPFLYPDNALGNNTTTENSRSAGNKASSKTNYAALLNTMNVAQNSGSLGFFPASLFLPYNKADDATYKITLSILDLAGTTTLASSNIWVTAGSGGVVPLPGAAGLGLLGMGLVGLRRRFRKTA